MPDATSQDDWLQRVLRATKRMEPKALARSAPMDLAAAKTAAAGWPANLPPTPEEATALLADMLPHPQKSRPEASRLRANLDWLAAAKLEAQRLAGRCPELEADRSTLPARFVQARLKVLGALGADPAASNALARAVFRGSAEEVQAVLEMPGCPAPGQAMGRGASALHRAAYDGPDQVFGVLARASSPADWMSRDSEGRVPFAKALQGKALGRMKAAFDLTPWEAFDTKPTPLADAAGFALQPETARWIVAGAAWDLGIRLCLSHPATLRGILWRADGSSFDLSHRPEVRAEIDRALLEEETPSARPTRSAPRI